MTGFLIQILVVLLVVGLIWWVIGQIGLPPPIVKVATIILVVVVVLWLIGLLTGGVPQIPMGHWGRS